MLDQLYVTDTPDEVKNAKGLHLLTTNTPNGQAVQVLLEELSDAYQDVTWTTSLIDIKSNEQKKEWFLRLNPNGRIPALVDNGQTPPFTVHESSAVMLYLLDVADKENRFSLKDRLEQSEALQWTLFWHGSGTPYLGQVIHSQNTHQRRFLLITDLACPTDAINRYRNEVLRVFDVLEIRLSGRYTREPRDYLAGRGKGLYSIADIKTWPWLKAWERIGFTKKEMDSFPHVLGYIDRIAERPAVKRGIGEKYDRQT